MGKNLYKGPKKWQWDYGDDNENDYEEEEYDDYDDFDEDEEEDDEDYYLEIDEEY